MQATLGQNQCFHRRLRALGKLVRTMTAGSQSLHPFHGVTIQIFITSLATDPELLAQFAHRKSRMLRQHHKANNLFHRAYNSPRHNVWKCNPSPRFVCYLSLRFEPFDGEFRTIDPKSQWLFSLVYGNRIFVGVAPTSFGGTLITSATLENPQLDGAQILSNRTFQMTVTG